MASWIVHMRVAQELIEKYHLKDKEEFVMGNIAPDSGVPKEDSSGYEPSKDISHFKLVNEQGRNAINYDLFIKTYFTEELRKSYTKQQDTFYLGYLTHLITDNQWRLQISEPAKKQFPELFASNSKKFWSIIKTDWYDLDFMFLKNHPDFEAFKLFKNIKSFKNTYMKEFSEDAFENRIQTVVAYYHEGVETVKERETYLTMAQMDEFVSETVNEIMNLCDSYLNELVK